MFLSHIRFLWQFHYAHENRTAILHWMVVSKSIQNLLKISVCQPGNPGKILFRGLRAFVTKSVDLQIFFVSLKMTPQSGASRQALSLSPPDKPLV